MLTIKCKWFRSLQESLSHWYRWSFRPNELQRWTLFSFWLAKEIRMYLILNCLSYATCFLTLKMPNFWKFTNKWSRWISDSYCSLKPLWLGIGEVVLARTSPTLHPPSPPTVLLIILFKSVPVHQLSSLALKEAAQNVQLISCKGLPKDVQTTTEIVDTHTCVFSRNPSTVHGSVSGSWHSMVVAISCSTTSKRYSTRSLEQSMSSSSSPGVLHTLSSRSCLCWLTSTSASPNWAPGHGQPVREFDFELVLCNSIYLLRQMCTIE